VKWLWPIITRLWPWQTQMHWEWSEKDWRNQTWQSRNWQKAQMICTSQNKNIFRIHSLLSLPAPFRPFALFHFIGLPLTYLPLLPLCLFSPARTNSPHPLAFSSGQISGPEPSELSDAAKAAIAELTEMPAIDISVDTSALRTNLDELEATKATTTTPGPGGEQPSDDNDPTTELDAEWRAGRESNVHWQGLPFLFCLL